MNKGNIYVVSAPSGTGKDTLLELVFGKHPEIAFSVSTITREKRKGSNDEQKYHFISVEEFKTMLKNDEFLEYNEFVGNYYGTPKKPVFDCVESGKDIILEVDVNGAAQIRKKVPEAISIFIMPPSYEALKKRLSSRGTDSPEVIEKRLKVALSEMERADEYDYIVVNDDLDIAVEDFLSVILSHRLETPKQKHLINEVLKNA